ncbi:hypothetical protein BSKO_09970 [Bryopsis sp. KO-2023]|nr:hypothetical protein BSKO_09970 [Bryopsis sp. KO-2023]
MAEQGVDRPPPTWSRRHEARSTTSGVAELGAGHPEPAVRRKCGAGPLNAPIKLNLPANLGSPRKVEQPRPPPVLQPITTRVAMSPQRQDSWAIPARSDQSWVDFGTSTPTTPSTPGHKHSRSMGEVLTQFPEPSAPHHRRVFSADQTSAAFGSEVDSVFDEFSKLALERTVSQLTPRAKQGSNFETQPEKLFVDLDGPDKVPELKPAEPDLIWIEEREWLKEMPNKKPTPLEHSKSGQSTFNQSPHLRRVSSVPTGQYFHTPRGLVFLENSTLAAYGLPLTPPDEHQLHPTMANGAMGGGPISAPLAVRFNQGFGGKQMSYSIGATGGHEYGVETVFQSSAGIR